MSTTTATKPVPHPATYPAACLALISRAYKAETLRLSREPLVADPMAGIGSIRRVIPNAWCWELESEWAFQTPDFPHKCGIGDASKVINIGPLDMVVVSPPWANRMADAYAGSPSDHEAKNGARSKRRTYRIALGRDLTEGSAAGLQWKGDGTEFCTEIVCILGPWVRALNPGGLLLVDIADHMRAGQWQPVSSTLANRITDALPVFLAGVTTVDAPRYTSGAAAGNVRMPELLIAFRRMG